MADLEFQLASTTACRGGDADYFARLYRLAGRRCVQPLPMVQLPTESIRLYSPSSLGRHIKPLLREGREQASNLGMVAWYRLCNHEGLRRLERIAIHVMQHPNAKIIDVTPEAQPPVNSHGLGVLTDPDTTFIHYDAAMYPTTPTEANAHPIMQVLEVPWRGDRIGAGYVALRGIETVIQGEQLYR